MIRTFILLLLSAGFNSGFAATGLKTDFLKKFPLKEGHYKSVPEKNQNWEFCEDEEMDIDLRDDGKSLTLTIGPRLVFPDLEKTEDLSPSEKNCSVKTINLLQNQTLKQTVSETCGKKRNYLKTHFFKLENDHLLYEFSAEGKTYHCRYQLLNQKEAKP